MISGKKDFEEWCIVVSGPRRQMCSRFSVYKIFILAVRIMAFENVVRSIAISKTEHHGIGDNDNTSIGVWTCDVTWNQP